MGLGFKRNPISHEDDARQIKLNIPNILARVYKVHVFGGGREGEKIRTFG